MAGDWPPVGLVGIAEGEGVAEGEGGGGGGEELESLTAGKLHGFLRCAEVGKRILRTIEVHPTLSFTQSATRVWAVGK